MSLANLIPGVGQAKLIGYGLAALALSGALTYGVHRYNEWIREPLKTKVTELTGDLDTCRKNGEALKTSIDKQNSAINALRLQAEKWAADSKKAAAEAKNLTTKSDQRVKEILASAPLNADLCESARLRLVPQ